MKPFNLKDALKGAALITRDGKMVDEFAAIDHRTSANYGLAVRVGTDRYAINGNGKFVSGESHDEDVFLAEPHEIKPAKLPTILEQAQKLIYGDREADYGSVTENFTNIAKGWSVIAKTELTPEQVGLMMVWVKISRQLNRQKQDNLIDAAGYLGCIEKIQNGK